VDVSAFITFLRCPLSRSPWGTLPPLDSFSPASGATLTDDRKQKLTFANEGAEKAKQEAEVIARKRKVEDQAKWEGESIRVNPCPRPHFLPDPRRPVSVSMPVSQGPNWRVLRLHTGLSLRRYPPTALRPRRILFPPVIVDYEQALTHDLLSPSPSPSPSPLPAHLLSAVVVCCAVLWSSSIHLVLALHPALTLLTHRTERRPYQRLARLQQQEEEGQEERPRPWVSRARARA
jgi:hypothetical protein